MAIDYISNLKCTEDLCNEFEEHILHLFLKEGESEAEHLPYFVWLRPYQEYFKPLKACVNLCEILKPESLRKYESPFSESASSLDRTSETKSIADFKRNVDILRCCFKIISNEISVICSSFDKEEKERMNEAIHAHFEDCNYSCVAMSVSAVESRLLKLMCLVSPESEQELEEKTLGQLIAEYIQNKSKYKNVVPKKHEVLRQ